MVSEGSWRSSGVPWCPLETLLRQLSLGTCIWRSIPSCPSCECCLTSGVAVFRLFPSQGSVCWGPAWRSTVSCSTACRVSSVMAGSLPCRCLLPFVALLNICGSREAAVSRASPRSVDPLLCFTLLLRSAPCPLRRSTTTVSRCVRGGWFVDHYTGLHIFAANASVLEHPL